jgi:hypothetical protein
VFAVIPRLCEDGRGVESHDVDSGELLGRHHDSAADCGTPDSRNREEFGEASEEGGAAKDFFFNDELVVCIILEIV